MTRCRTYGARILFGIDSSALPGWADVWQSAPSTSSGQALRAGHQWLFLPVSFLLSQPASGKSTARDDKGDVASKSCKLRLSWSPAHTLKQSPGSRCGGCRCISAGSPAESGRFVPGSPGIHAG